MEGVRLAIVRTYYWFVCLFVWFISLLPILFTVLYIKKMLVTNKKQVNGEVNGRVILIILYILFIIILSRDACVWELKVFSLAVSLGGLSFLRFIPGTG